MLLSDLLFTLLVLQEALRAGHMEAAAFLQEMEQQHKAALAAVARSASMPADTVAAAEAAAETRQQWQLLRAFQSLQGEHVQQPQQQQQQQRLGQDDEQQVQQE
jgi:hypothetical protein